MRSHSVSAHDGLDRRDGPMSRWSWEDIEWRLNLGYLAVMTSKVEGL
jgi:hypothetical protein